MMPGLRSLAVAMLCAALLPMAAAATVELRADAEVSGAAYRLQDIARVSGDDAADIADIKIGLAPRPGHSAHLSQAQIAGIVARHAPRMRNRLQWGGSKSVVVRAAGVTVEGQRLAQLAADFLQQELGRRYDRFEAEPVERAREIMLPAGAQMRIRPLAGKVSRRTAVWIDIETDGRAYTAVPIWFSVKAWQPVPVARQDLAAGSELKEADFVTEMYDVLQMPRVVGALPPAGSVRLRRAIARGAPLTADAVEGVPAISRHQQVAVRLAAGNIVIETSGLAQASGKIGETVAVMNTGSSEIFLAKVVEPGVVMVNAR